ncbi:hypothetical protein E8E13_011672 [Curvularia kusanoi]|uniref:mRNA stability protein n=1 Tax=Curvularia kusanoi TaxID=90978 RepID=A0A9P5BTS1_CURKU|nr:hypothetical protein E8E13_011672 [Curvularia kusanoi]
MNPHQQNKVDISERKYFDSGDYALSKAGKASDAGVTQVGREHPNPEKIPHMTPSTPGTGQTPATGDLKASSPSKEGGTFLHRETSLNRETSASDFTDGAEPQTQQV